MGWIFLIKERGFVFSYVWMGFGFFDFGREVSVVFVVFFEIVGCFN